MSEPVVECLPSAPPSAPSPPPPTGVSVPIGLRVYASCSQGGRKYMEDNYDLKYQFNGDNELQYIYLGIFDGHGGDVAAKYAKHHLCHNIIRQRGFWSSTDDHVLKAIHKGFIQTHYDMRKEVLNWPKTASGLPSTSGTTASVVFIMNGKYYTGHVGDSRIVLGRKHVRRPGALFAAYLRRPPVHYLFRPHLAQQWNRPKLGHKGPIRRSTSFDQIPFLAVARSLGDLWSFNSQLNTFIVSPEPDLKCIPIDANDQCLLLASDGLWNMMTTQTAVKVLQEVEEDQYSPELLEAIFDAGSARLSPSRALVHFCLNRWYQSRFRADNTTVLAVMLEDNQGIELMKNNQNLPYLREKSLSLLLLSLLPILLLVTTTEGTTAPTVPETTDSSNATELDNSSTCPQSDDTNQSIVLTPLVNLPPNFQTNDNNVFEAIDNSNSNSNPQTIETTTNIDDNDSQSNESSRDSGTSSPPTPTVISASDELTEEEYAALPSLVNLSQNEWELHVVIDPKNLSVNSTDLNAVSISGEENSCLMSGQSSLANINKVIEENTSLNNYIYSKTGFLRHHSQTPNGIMNGMNGSDCVLTPTDNYWSESSSYYQMTSIKPRTSLPLSLVDNHSPVVGVNYSPLISLNDRNTSSMGDNIHGSNSLCIFGALSNATHNPNDNAFQKLSKVFSQSNNEIKSDDTISGDRKKRSILRHSRLLRRISIDSNGAKVRQTLLASRGVKRKCSSDYSPPSKHLRSSLWTRPLVSKEHLMRMSFTRSLKQLAVGRLTRSRLRPIKLLKSFSKK
ncbi:unnamed protein product [Oppiella nova]|uniref:PPM-type phosphatase domain-containing protein n=1 Tax=Oppiella nova TaxID=334625 RepID=A0A7R9LEZ6_9ACAR|nr:unnamed protein product [Oppiella nova]CAG2163000.1 unnamed protein product [Oppiella nova]